MDFDKNRRRALSGGGTLALGFMMAGVGGCGGGAAEEPTHETAQTRTTPPRTLNILGYTDRESYAPGQTIRLRLGADDAGAVPTDVQWEVRRHLDDALVASGSVSIACVTPHGCEDQQWPVALSGHLTAHWPSGVYYVQFSSSSTGTRVHFVLRDASVPPNPLLLVVPTATMQAYNNYGGKALYDDLSTDGVRASSVSTHRPIAPWPGTEGSNFEWGYQHSGIADLVAWLHATGRAPALATDQDLHATPGLLDGRRCVILAGHDEYWSRTMRDRIDGYAFAGGHVANLGGNTAVWQIDYQDEATTIHCLKAPDPDPSVPLAAQTYAWHRIGRSAATSFGSAPEWGAYNHRGLPSLPLTAWRTSHWAYWQTGLTDGSSFAGDLPIANYEVDGIDVVWIEGLPAPRPGSATPSVYQVLGHATATGWYGLDCPLGNWTVGIGSYPGGGTVFNAATVNWGLAMRGVGASVDANAIVRMTDNVLRHFLAPDIVVWRSSDGAVRAHLPQDAPPPDDGRTWEREGPLCHAPPQAIDAEMLPLWRWHASGEQGTTEVLALVDPGPGWIHIGVAGWVYAAPGPGRVPLHEHRPADAADPDVRYSLSATLADGGPEGRVVAWVLA